MNRRSRLGRFAALACAAAAAASTTVVVAAGAAESSAARGHAVPEELVSAWPADITTLDPANLSTTQDYEMAKNVYQTLVLSKFAPQKNGTLLYNDNKLVPDLAQSWTVGKTSVTFHLRHGVTFYGTKDVMTAADVKWTFARLFKTPAVGDMQANGLQHPSQIHVVNPYEITFDFETPQGKPAPANSTAIAIFREPWMSIIDEAAVKRHETTSDPTGSAWLRGHAAGTGVYYIAKRVPGVSFTLEAAPHSWSPQPDFKTVKIRIASSNVSSLLESGQVNVGEFGMTDQQLNQLASAGLVVDHGNTTEFDILAIGSGDNSGPLSKVDVRKAIADAIPYQEIVKSVLFGRGHRDLSIVDHQSPAYVPAWSVYSTDVAKAKRLMAAAGNPTASVPLYYLSGNVDQQSIALLLQASFKQLGISAVLTPETQAGLFDVLDARATPAKGAKIGVPGLVLFNWNPWKTDPKIVIGYWATKGGINNYSRWSSPVVDAINKKYAPLADSSARTAAYKKAQRIIAAAAPVIPIASTGRNVVVAHGITNVPFGPNPGIRFWLLRPVGRPSPLAAVFES